MDRFKACLAACARRDGDRVNLIGLSLFRIVAGLAILSQLLTMYQQRYYLFGNEGLIPYGSYTRQMSHFSLYWFTNCNVPPDDNPAEKAREVTKVVRKLLDEGRGLPGNDGQEPLPGAF